MLTLLLETWNHRRSHAVLKIHLRKRESCMSAEGSRRTPRNEVGEMLNENETVITISPRDQTWSTMTCDFLLDLVTPKALLGSS